MDIKKKIMLGIGSVASMVPFVSATSVIDNDTLTGMPQLGSDLGDFLGNLGPGLGKFMLILGIFGGIVAILGGIFWVIKKAVTKNR